MNKLYRITLDATKTLLATEDFVQTFHSVEELTKNITEPVIVVVDGINIADCYEAKILKLVCNFRKSKLLYACPLYFTTSVGELDYCSDGIENSKSEILAQGNVILDRLNLLSIEKNSASSDLRLLTFLFARGEEYLLKPQLLPSSPWLYQYMTAALLGRFCNELHRTLRSNCDENDKSNHKEESSVQWLNYLLNHGLLVEKQLVDRVRYCPYCMTGNLNFIDMCPLCGSINFSKHKMIHCFTCANVAPEEEFQKGYQLVCPRCKSTLRHIGVDYDRPLESYQCNDCHGKFIEPQIKASCLNCQEKSSAEDLIARPIYNYAISAKGMRAAQLGDVNLEIALFDDKRNVLPLYFYQMIDWMLQMKQRYQDAEFTLICIKIISAKDLDEVAYLPKANDVIAELSVRVRELVRNTDITTNTSKNVSWVMLPRTNTEGGEILAARIENLAQMVSTETNSQIRVAVKCFSIPTEQAQQVPIAEKLLTEYEAGF